MYRTKPQSGYYVVDGRRVWLDSKSEYDFIMKLVRAGFAGKWSRPFGVRYGRHNYTADFVLDVLWNGLPRQAFVEYKPISANEFSINSRTRAISALHYYGADPLLLLYVGKTNTWWQVDAATKQLIRIAAPEPAPDAIALPRRVSLPIVNAYGRGYSSVAWVAVVDTIVGIVEEVVRHLTPGSRYRSAKRRHSR